MHSVNTDILIEISNFGQSSRFFMLGAESAMTAIVVVVVVVYCLIPICVLLLPLLLHVYNCISCQKQLEVFMHTHSKPFT